MKKIILTFIFIFAIVGCVAQVESQVQKAKKTCTLSYLRTSFLPDTNSLLISSGFTGGTGTSSGSTSVTTITTSPVNISKDTTRVTTFASPQFISSINISGSTVTGSVTIVSDLHVYTFKGSSTFESWLIKLNSTSTAVCKAGQLSSISSVESANFSNLVTTITTNELSLSASNLAVTYIACVSPNSSLITSGSSSTPPTFPISYSINLRKDSAATSGSSFTSTLTESRNLAAQAKQLKADIDFVNCLNGVDALAELKKWVLF